MGNSGHMAFHLPFQEVRHDAHHVRHPQRHQGQLPVLGRPGQQRPGPGYQPQDAAVRPGHPGHRAPCRRTSTSAPTASRQPVPPGSGGVIFLPWFNGSISPGQDEYLRGGFLNLSHSTGRCHLVRAVFEGLSMNWRWLREPAEKLSGRKFQYWRLTGGGALSNVWAQIMADVVGIPMHRQANPRIHNVLGMGLLAFNRLGKLKLEDMPGMIKFDRVFEPDPTEPAPSTTTCTRSSTEAPREDPPGVPRAEQELRPPRRQQHSCTRGNRCLTNKNPLISLGTCTPTTSSSRSTTGCREKGRGRGRGAERAGLHGRARRTRSGWAGSAPAPCTTAAWSTTPSSTRSSACTPSSTCCSATCARAAPSSRPKCWPWSARCCTAKR